MTDENVACSPKTEVCPHGSLARQCELCDKDAEIAALGAENRRQAQEIGRLRAALEASGPGRHIAFRRDLARLRARVAWLRAWKQRSDETEKESG